MIVAVAALLMPGTQAARAADDFATRIQPLLIDRCGACHGEDRQRGELALHTPEAIARGGASGPLFVAGKPAESELLRRLRLPEDDIDHMPPKGKPQLTADEISLIEAWIAAGASFKAPDAPAVAAPGGDGDQSVAAASRGGRKPARQDSPATAATQPAGAPDEPPPADIRAMNALRDHLVHVAVVAAGSNRLHINFAAAARTITEAQVMRLLEPVLEQIESLSLARCAVGDETATLLARAPRLRRLDLRGCQITDAGIASLSKLAGLEVLIVAQTRLTDAAAKHLAAFTGLQRVYVWQAGMSDEAIAALRRQRPGLYVDAGTSRYATTQAVEPDIKLTSDAPPPDAPQASAAKPQARSDAAAPLPAPAQVSEKPAASAPAAGPGVALQAVNSVCPVSGKPIDARFSVVHQGRVVGFCCPKCPGAFWENPARFEAKLAGK